VAARAILEIGYAFFAVLALDFSRIVLMAGVAIIACQATWVARAAGAYATRAVIEGEGMRLIIERWRPT